MLQINRRTYVGLLAFGYAFLEANQASLEQFKSDHLYKAELMAQQTLLREILKDTFKRRVKEQRKVRFIVHIQRMFRSRSKEKWAMLRDAMRAGTGD